MYEATQVVRPYSGLGFACARLSLVLPEIHLARALYRCGDYDGVAEKILRAYANALHAHYARHAQAILQEKIKP